MAYVELYAAGAERRARLRESKGFECGCGRCQRGACAVEMRLSQVDVDGHG